MRYIDSTRLRLPDDWLNRAAAAKAAVSQGSDPDTHAAIWRELKDGLADLFNDKCWYCELPVPRSDNAVDHFRPKGAVIDAANPHSGYRWLAFEVSNFRYACTYCNSRRRSKRTAGGKAAHFPLRDESKRVYVQGSTANEGPVLLDPCEWDEWRLLGCKRENGKPCATSDDMDKRRRAEVSIDLYHLHHEPTCKLRHAAALKLLSDIDEAKGLFMKAQVDQTQEHDFKKTAKRILTAIHIDSPFSGDMRFLLGGERDEAHYSWIQDLLST